MVDAHGNVTQVPQLPSTHAAHVNQSKTVLLATVTSSHNVTVKFVVGCSLAIIANSRTIVPSIDRSLALAAVRLPSLFFSLCDSFLNHS